MLEKIRENIRKRQEEYYIKAFKRLDETKKNTWNWAAFFFGGIWMIYRKMYLYGFLFEFGMSLLEICISSLFYDGDSAKNHSIIRCLIAGSYGNALYYQSIKNKVRKGYHLLDKYRPTSISAAFIPFGLLVYFADWFSNKEKLKENSENEVNEESIRAYLNPRKENSRAVKIANIGVFLMISLIAILFFKSQQL